MSLQGPNVCVKLTSIVAALRAELLDPELVRAADGLLSHLSHPDVTDSEALLEQKIRSIKKKVNEIEMEITAKSNSLTDINSDEAEGVLMFGDSAEAETLRRVLDKRSHRSMSLADAKAVIIAAKRLRPGILYDCLNTIDHDSDFLRRSVERSLRLETASCQVELETQYWNHIEDLKKRTNLGNVRMVEGEMEIAQCKQPVIELRARAVQLEEDITRMRDLRSLSRAERAVALSESLLTWIA